ncbi:hypothetical protein [Streptomyces sp. NPDC091879]|jgi:hypothetical protein|uniref:hypothetical protein n=1 Tax=Streptomyces sp. NPDC091879 TaxID=3366006 RepID=UPI00382D57C5
MDDLAEGRTIHARVAYVHDKEIHVSTVQSPQDGLFIDCREYIPSLDTYGRGLTLPIGLLDEFLKGVESAWHENGAGGVEDETRDRLTGEAQVDE